MKIQRHVRQDFQPVYIKLETLREVQMLSELLDCTTEDKDVINWGKTLGSQLDEIDAAGGILP